MQTIDDYNRRADELRIQIGELHAVAGQGLRSAGKQLRRTDMRPAYLIAGGLVAALSGVCALCGIVGMFVGNGSTTDQTRSPEPQDADATVGNTGVTNGELLRILKEGDGHDWAGMNSEARISICIMWAGLYTSPDDKTPPAARAITLYDYLDELTAKSPDDKLLFYLSLFQVGHDRAEGYRSAFSE